MKIIYTENNTKIIDSYKYNIAYVTRIIMQERQEKNLQITRTFISYASEIKAHNRLYRLGLFRSHTKDTDLEENQSKLWNFIWRIIGW